MRITDKNGEPVELGGLFWALAVGVKSSQIRRAFDISRKSVATAKGAFIAAKPDQLVRIQRSHKKMRVGKRHPQEKKLRFLVDECVSPAVTYYVSRYMGWATHIVFENMGGTKDPAVDQYAYNEGFDAIFTSDKAQDKSKNLEKDDLQDLTDLAFARAIKARFAERKGDGYRDDVRYKNPVLIRIEGKKDWDSVRNKIKRFLPDLEKAIQERTSPLIILTDKGVVFGPTYDDIFHQSRKPPPEELLAKARESKKSNPAKTLVDKWMKGAEKANGKPLSRRQRRFIRQKCTAYLAKLQVA